jgi:hypothetical protein
MDKIEIMDSKDNPICPGEAIREVEDNLTKEVMDTIRNSI